MNILRVEPSQFQPSELDGSRKGHILFNTSN